MKCPKCGKPYNGKKRCFCNKKIRICESAGCGERVSYDTKYCSSCREELGLGDYSVDNRSK